ncbi:unnamed protein product [Adineta ricciae]|uniref:Uncharacterized protein n=1 Tax=Adineta ricciae TaxID=249248 RepID=A0A816D017_ADIRI|nr:unnamed protein product [Adineta ricciae]CAF1627916.1 unnamed protein product [Adineta ricciae]
MQGRHEACICPRCPDSERHENYPAMMKRTNRFYQPQVLQARRKQLAHFSLFSHYDCRTITSRISESVWDITDINERQQSDGTESWHIHEIKPQRESFARISPVEIMSPSSKEANFPSSPSEPQFESHINDIAFKHVPETTSQRLLFVYASCSAKLGNEQTIVYFTEHQQSHCSIQLASHFSRPDSIIYGHQHLLFLLKSTWVLLLLLI